VEIDDSPVVALNRAVAIAEVHGARAGIDAVEAIQNNRQLGSYYLLYAVLAEFESQLNDLLAAANHLRKALQLTGLKSEQSFLLSRLRDCESVSAVPFDAAASKLLQGSLRFHASHSEMAAKTLRGFCPECGSPIQVKPDAVPQFVAIRTASLDDPSWFTLQMDVWTSDAHPWDQMNPALPKFEKYPS